MFTLYGDKRKSLILLLRYVVIGELYFLNKRSAKPFDISLQLHRKNHFFYLVSTLFEQVVDSNVTGLGRVVRGEDEDGRGGIGVRR